MSDKLAEHAHDVWANWMKHMFSTAETMHGENYSQLQGESVGRWKRQMNIPYSELSPKEQESDKRIAAEWAKLVLEEYNKWITTSKYSNYIEDDSMEAFLKELGK